MPLSPERLLQSKRIRAAKPWSFSLLAAGLERAGVLTREFPGDRHLRAQGAGESDLRRDSRHYIAAGLILSSNRGHNWDPNRHARLLFRFLFRAVADRANDVNGNDLRFALAQRFDLAQGRDDALVL